MILGKDNRKPWSQMDIALATAHQLLENERCAQCGMYVWMCHTEDPDMQFEIIEDSCNATKAVANVSKLREKKLAEKPWVKLKPRPLMGDEERDFPSLRTPYFETEMERLGLGADS